MLFFLTLCRLGAGPADARRTVARQQQLSMADEDQEAAGAPAEPEAAILAAERAELRGLVRAGTHCGVCGDAFVTPHTTVLLPCAHTVHTACAKDELRQGRPLSCRECGTVVQSLATEADVDHMPASVEVEARLLVRVPCTACEADEEIDPAERNAAAYRCKDCPTETNLCMGHADIHPTKRSTRGHALTVLVGAAGAGGMVTHAAQCSVHPGRPLELFCRVCQRACCTACAATQCKAHDTPTIESELGLLQQALLAAHTAAFTYAAQVEAWLVEAAQVQAEVVEQQHALKTHVHATFVALHALLDRDEVALTAQIDADAQTQTRILATARQEAQLLWLTTHQAAEMAVRLQREEVTETEVAVVAGPLTAHLLAAVQVPLPPLPVMHVVEVVAVPADLDRILQGALRLAHRQAHGPRCTVAGDGLARADMGKANACVVTAMTRGGLRVTVGGDRVHARLVGSDGVVATAAVTDKNDGTYELSYSVPVATALGHRLHVEVNGKAVADSPFTVVSATEFHHFTYTGPPCYDNHGLFYWLGTVRGTRAWQNPHDNRALRVTLSSNPKDKPVRRLVANVAPVVSDSGGYRLFTADKPNSWMAVALLGGVRVRPTGYVLSTDWHGASGNHLVRSWQLQGSVDGQTWTTLRTHTKDTTLTQQTVSAYWPIEGVATDAYYAHVRLLQTRRNSKSNDYLTATSLEVYGDVVVLPL
jgi:hypothetical protein